MQRLAELSERRSLWGAWIEMHNQTIRPAGYPVAPFGERGLKFVRQPDRFSGAGVAPFGERGLKW